MSLDWYLHKVVAEEREVFWRNITHNLGRMANEAGIYQCLWRPDEVGITHAVQCIKPLEEGLAKLKADPEHFRMFNAKNGWGAYEGLVSFVEEALEACRRDPDAKVSASR